MLKNNGRLNLVAFDFTEPKPDHFEVGVLRLQNGVGSQVKGFTSRGTAHLGARKLLLKGAGRVGPVRGADTEVRWGLAFGNTGFS